MMGMELMLKALGIDGAAVKQAIGNIGQLVVDLKSQMDRIEHQQKAILEMLLAERGLLEPSKSETKNGSGVSETQISP